VPWRPPLGDADPDHRFDPYRERAGRLFSDEHEAGFVFVRLTSAVIQLGGVLWWRRWSAPYEVVQEYYALSTGWFTDTVTDADDLADEVLDWSAGRLNLGGELYRVEWLDDEESTLARDEVFGLGA
jgi:hypothetical protein